MQKSLIYKEFTITLAPGQSYNLDFFPFKMQEVEVFNLGANDAQAMINDASLPNGITVVANGDRTFRASGPSFPRVTFYSVLGTTLRVVTAR
jgi:hypothetical protein